MKFLEYGVFACVCFGINYSLNQNVAASAFGAWIGVVTLVILRKL